MKKNTLPIAVVVTVLNEEQSIPQLLTGLKNQTHLPQEIIIVDGGSSDKTLEILKIFAQKNPTLPLHFYTQVGNRSMGRNYGMTHAHQDWIAITDAGCVPELDWLEKLWHKKQSSQADVVAGYYSARSTTPFEEAVVPYVLVMPDKIDPQHFLPATRSMLLRKKVWQELGRFDENLSDNEDYAFAKKLEHQRDKYKLVFAQDAVVVWQPRSSLSSFVWMIFRFARGDITAGILRPKVALIFARYILFLVILILAVLSPTSFWQAIFFAAILAYLLWSIAKNIRYTPRGWYWLPVLQIGSDAAVMAGSLVGLAKKIRM